MSRRPTLQPSLRDHVDPIFRFWGHIDPRGRTKPAILDRVGTTTDDAVAVLRLYDPIDSWGGEWGVSAKEVAEVFAVLPPDTAEIRLHINSPGGEIFEAVAIMNLLRAHPAKVVAVVDGIAASAASFIAASADELVMGRNTELMIHDGIGLCWGNAADMRDIAGILDRLSDDIAGVYAEKAGGGVATWRAAMQAESWYSADEAVTAGLADRVDRPDQQDEAAATDRFDLATLFAHARRADAPAPVMPTDEPEPAPVDDGQRVRHAKNRHRLAAARHHLTV